MSDQSEDVKSVTPDTELTQDQISPLQEANEKLMLVQSKFAGKFDEKALLVLLSHACKYPSNNLCGILIGKASKDEVKITRVIPLTHNLAVAPVIETALNMIDLSLDTETESIIGLYAAASFVCQFDDKCSVESRLSGYISSLPHIVHATYTAIKRQQPHAVLAVLCNDNFVSDSERLVPSLPVLMVYPSLDPSSAQPLCARPLVWGTLRHMVRNDLHRALDDFDAALDSDRSEWPVNGALLSHIDTTMQKKLIKSGDNAK